MSRIHLWLLSSFLFFSLFYRIFLFFSILFLFCFSFTVFLITFSLSLSLFLQPPFMSPFSVFLSTFFSPPASPFSFYLLCISSTSLFLPLAFFSWYKGIPPFFPFLSFYFFSLPCFCVYLKIIVRENSFCIKTFTRNRKCQGLSASLGHRFLRRWGRCNCLEKWRRCFLWGWCHAAKSELRFGNRFGKWGCQILKIKCSLNSLWISQHSGGVS